VKALLKQSEPRLYLEGDALFEEVLYPRPCPTLADPNPARELVPKHAPALVGALM